MATVELTKNTGTYSVEAITWAPIQLIPEIGVTQLKIYFAAANSNVWTELTKNSWKSTYNGMSQTISLKLATYTSNGSEVPANINPTVHKIKVKRVTSPTLYITFNEGAKLSGRDLNIVNLQCIHLLEEEAARLDLEDADIYTYVSEQLTNYYTKTEIDSFFNSQELIPAWTQGQTYVIGDVVLHDDPLTAQEANQIWYCTTNHTATTGNQPTATGSGSGYWSLSQNNTVLDNLNYIRRMPGIGDSFSSSPLGLEWNTIQIQNKEAYALRVLPHPSQSANLIEILNASKQIVAEFTANNQFVLKNASHFFVKNGSSWLNYEPRDLRFNNPTLSIRGKSGENALEISRSTAVNNTEQVVFTVNDGNTASNNINLHIKDKATQFIGNLIWFSNSTAENCWGDTSSDTFTEVRFGRDANFGTLASCFAPFSSTCRIEAATGNIISQGTIESPVLSASNKVVTNIINADYLKTDNSGTIIAGTGSPTSSRSIVAVSNSNTSLLNKDVVYLSNDTGLWTKSRADNKFTLAMGMVDGVSGTAGNQSFSVVFSGLVSGFTGLEIGNWYWLSKDVAGAITSIRPENPGDILDPVGIAISATSLFVITARAHKLPTGSTTNGSTSPGGTGDVATDTIWDAKGDLAVGFGSNQAQRLPVGANGQMLVVDSTQTLGVKWASISSSFDFGTIITPSDFTLDLGGI